MEITQKITLDLRRKSYFRNVEAKQGDRGTRFVEVTLTDNGAAYTVPEGVSAVFRCVKPDGNGVMNPAVIQSDGTILAELTGQVLAVPGAVMADISLTNEAGEILSSASFVILVEPVPMGAQADSSSEFLILLQIIEEGKALLEELDDVETGFGARVTRLEQDMEELKYVPIAFQSVKIRNTVFQKGNYPEELEVSWKLNKEPKDYMFIDGLPLTLADLDSGSLREGSASIPYCYMDEDVTIVIFAKDERDTLAREDIGIKFYPGVYYGTAEAGVQIDSEEILGWKLSLQGGKATSFTVNAAQGQHIGFALPVSYGVPVFYVGGFEGGFYKYGTVPFTNAYGHTEDYDVWLSSNTGLGSTSVTVK